MMERGRSIDYYNQKQIVVVSNEAVYIQIQLEIAHAFPCTITILGAVGCVTKTTITRSGLW